ncbi:MAG: GNAT family N-acetyltransferase, partial [Dehalococcoidia bacterium]|nr:GNAT family N-acetyltransferase [Dehalococcoidia bacterium]
MGYIIRRMQDRDIPQALEIDREAFPSQWPHPTYASFKQELRNRLACYILVTKPRESEAIKQNPANRRCWQKIFHLFDHDRLFGDEIPPPKEYIVGIAGFWVMVDEAHITTLALRDSYRRQGVGERLLIEIIEMAVQFN